MKTVYGRKRVTTVEELKEHVKFEDIKEYLDIEEDCRRQLEAKGRIEGGKSCEWCDRTCTRGPSKIDYDKKEITFFVEGKFCTLVYSENKIEWTRVETAS